MLEPAVLSASLLLFSVIPGTAPDLLGDRIGGISSLRWVESSQELYALPDRGPIDGTVPYAPRFQVFAVGSGEGRVELFLKRTVLLKDEKGRPFSGLIKTTSSRLDPEGLVVASDGTLWVSEEYEPAVYHFSRDGAYLGKLAVPEHYIPGEKTGRQRNRGLEGLCLAPDGNTLAALLQSPPLQDGGKNGTTTRMLIWDLAKSSAAPREVLVPMPLAQDMPAEWNMKQKNLAYNECEAVSAEEFLLLERDNRGAGADAGDEPIPRFKRAARFRLPEVEGGAGERIPAFDLLEVISSGGINVNELPVKFESLAWGPKKDGRRTLWSAIDNDFQPQLPTYFFLFSIYP